jgi:hypothetical protein
MEEAAENVRAMQAAARASGDGALAVPEATTTMEDTTATPEQREAFDRIMENRRQLEENIEEAHRCCGLPSDFLDEELQELDAEIKVLRTELGVEQDQLQETTESTRDQYDPETTGAIIEQYRPEETIGVVRTDNLSN